MNFDWHNEKRRIKDLVPYVANPRQITEKQAKDLKASLERFGVADPLIINTDNTIIGGHQRKKILETLMGIDPDYEIDVRVPDRELSIDEMRELNVRLNKNTGSFDFDILANNFELDDLLDWGFEKSDLDLYYAPEFDEYDESVADDVEMIECPNCGHHFPK
jgi:site-specific DNA-methyltransferase (adenine-specific)